MIAEVLPNERIAEVYLGIPPGHNHLRLCLRAGDRWLVFSEATVANLVRAYISSKTHPQIRTVHLVQSDSGEWKAGYARHQLIETDEDRQEVEAGFARLWRLIESDRESRFPPVGEENHLQ